MLEDDEIASVVLGTSGVLSVVLILALKLKKSPALGEAAYEDEADYAPESVVSQGRRQQLNPPCCRTL